MPWLRRLITPILCLCLLFSAAKAEKQVVMTFVGDCTVGCEDRLRGKDNSFAAYIENKGYGYFLAKVKDFFSEDDLTVANFEGVLKADSYGAASKTYCFRGLPEDAQILSLGGVEAVNLSNNHASDYGASGRRTTIEALTAAGIATFNADEDYVYEKDGVKIAFIGFWVVGYNVHDAICEKVREVKAEGVDAVICVLHFGREYATAHEKGQTDIARQVIDAGADLVIGHHPHVVQGMENYQNRMIFYSLGNFLFGGNAEVRSNESLAVRVTMTFADDGAYLGQQARIYPANESGDAENNDYQPRLVGGEAAEAVYARFDADCTDDNADYEQTDDYREYPFLAAETDEEAQ